MYPDLRSAHLRPAGQADMTITPEEAYPSSPALSGTDLAAALDGAPDSGAITSTGTPSSTGIVGSGASGFTETPALTPAQQAQQQAQQAALYNTIGSALQTAGTTVGTIIASGDRARIADLQQQTLLRIAQLQSQAQTAQAAGQLQLAQQNSAQAQQAQAALLQLGLGAPTNTATIGWVVGGVVVVLLAGLGVYLATRPPPVAAAPAAAPRASRSRSRSYRNPAAAAARRSR